MTEPARIGVYQDGPFRRVAVDGNLRFAPDPVDAPFLEFVREVADGFDALVLFARVDPLAVPDDRLVLPASVEVVELPDYGDLRRLLAVARAAVRTAISFWRGLGGVDVVWAFGPHPFQLLLVTLARLRGRRVVLGVRQDTREYFRARLPGPRWKPVLGAVAVLDWLHRVVARRVPATVVGEASASRYASGRARVLAMAPSLVRAADVAPGPAGHDWDGTIELLTVGRIDAEKNPFLLVDAMAALDRERPGGYRLRWVGVGPMAEAVRARAASVGLQDRVELVGYVPFGPELLGHYRRAHAFVHVSLTEGVPQVLAEAHASAIPIVATDVGGVGRALEHGRAGLLVPPSELAALTGALRRLSDDAELRSRLIERGLELASERTLEAEAARVAAFIAGR